MEHDDKALPIDIALLGKIAERCQADAKALHYKEMEFLNEQDSATIEALIEIYTRLQLSESAQGTCVCLLVFVCVLVGVCLSKYVCVCACGVCMPSRLSLRFTH